MLNSSNLIKCKFYSGQNFQIHITNPYQLNQAFKFFSNIFFTYIWILKWVQIYLIWFDLKLILAISNNLNSPILGYVHVTMSAGWQACRKTCMHGGRQAHRHAPPCNWQTQLVDLGQSQATTVCFLNVLWGFLLLSIKSLISHYKIADASSKKV